VVQHCLNADCIVFPGILEVSQSQNVTVVGATPAFRLENAIKLLPKFNEQNVEEYLIGFEKVAEINNWLQDSYASVLHAMLVGRV